MTGTEAPKPVSVHGVSMKIKLTSVIVDDQGKALNFYTHILGFRLKKDIVVGDFRWLTVVDEEGGTELLLEPNENPAGRDYQTSLFEQGVPLTSFESENIDAEVRRLKSLGVQFRVEPSIANTSHFAVFEDGCGNLLQLYQATTPK